MSKSAMALAGICPLILVAMIDSTGLRGCSRGLAGLTFAAIRSSKRLSTGADWVSSPSHFASGTAIIMSRQAFLSSLVM
ncbi:hypothetical protein JQX13_33475 [Archangium violaceum]|uniref:hypothetical protein n=1 Tax=Archangium violaceum TaxID=83451 RepID=UPI00193BFC32|nr:hypothetical protein [Archangium violaceum]QRK05094.1 hypothetical protein JQX13_33475 [Archangium violaceum]